MKALIESTKFLPGLSDEGNEHPLLRRRKSMEMPMFITPPPNKSSGKQSTSMRRPSISNIAKLNLCFLSLVIAGIVFLAAGCVGLYCSIYNWILIDLLEMRGYSPLYRVWASPPHDVTFSINIFEAVNHEEFLASNDPNVRLELRDIGAVVYKEHLQHVNVTHHPENGTMSFTTVRWAEFDEDRNVPGILNRSIIVPNFALLGTLSFLHDISFFAKIGFNLMLTSLDEPIFLNTTVYDFLWNYRSNVISVAHKILPDLVPVENLGVMHRMYENYVDRVNVQVGQTNGNEDFFKMNLYNDRPSIPGYYPERGDCNASLVGSTEGILYPKMMTNASVINYYRSSICRVIPLYYNSTTEMRGMKVLEFVLPPSAMNRNKNLSADCSKGDDPDDYLPDGLSDLSKCYYNFPMVLSLPHFYGFEDSPWMSRLTGLQAEKELHESKIYAEPVIGVGLHQFARSQSNIYIRDLSGFSDVYKRFSHMVIPVFWGELMLEEVPPMVLALMKFTVIYLPLIDQILPWVFILTGLALWTISLKINFRKTAATLIRRDENRHRYDNFCAVNEKCVEMVEPKLAHHITVL